MFSGIKSDFFFILLDSRRSISNRDAARSLLEKIFCDVISLGVE